MEYLYNFTPQWSNLWRLGRADPRYGTEGYPGRCPGEQIKQLLWFYTNENDTVIDPFAGGGTTLDVCNEWKRTCYASDIEPCRSDIMRRDVLIDGLVDVPAKLIILDPPYSSQVEYTQHPTDFSQMTLNDYLKNMERVGRDCLDILQDNGHVVLIISSMRKDGLICDIPFKIYRRFVDLGYRLGERMCVQFQGMSSQTGYWVAGARKGGFMLRSYKDQFVFVRGDYDPEKDKFENVLSRFSAENYFR